MARRRKPTIRQARKIALQWESEIQALMVELNLSKVEDSEHIQRWQASTRHGTLEITHFVRSAMYADAAECMVELGLYSRFSEPARAKSAGMDCNPHSGKWNWHFFDCEIPDAINRIRGDLNSILIAEAQAA